MGQKGPWLLTRGCGVLSAEAASLGVRSVPAVPAGGADGSGESSLVLWGTTRKSRADRGCRAALSPKAPLATVLGGSDSPASHTWPHPSKEASVSTLMHPTCRGPLGSVGSPLLSLLLFGTLISPSLSFPVCPEGATTATLQELPWR